MAILIDEPRWPAHGTLFSHLVSDESLAELHQFAAAAGIPEQAFDRDHYDVAARHYDALVARGAEPVAGRDLIRRLRTSGLRVPARARPAKAAVAAQMRWPQHLNSTIADDLLQRWSQPHRHYHDVTHLLAVLQRLEELCAPAAVPVTVALAAWFHDAVYEGATTDEAQSAELARTLLAGACPPAQIENVVRLIALTTTHAPAAGDVDGALLCDADLAVLGSDAAGYQRYRDLVRADYAHVSDADWRIGRAAVLTALLAHTPLFHTRTGQLRWEAAARANLERELADLR